MKPIRILHVVTIMNRGGLETMLMNYYRKVDRTKIQFDFMVNRQERGHYDNEIEQLGGRIYRLSPIRPGNYRKYLHELNEFFKNHREYKVVHAHINENSGFVLKVAQRYHIPCRIAHSHLADLTLDYKYPFRLLGRSYLRWSQPTDYFACSKEAGTWLFGKKITNQGRVKVLNNAVDTEDFYINQTIRRNVREELGIQEKLVIGHVGRFGEQKNHTFLIDIFAEVHKQRKDAILLLIGEGALQRKMEQKVKKLGIESHVRFLGVRDDISNLMHGMDLFLFPSLFEGLPVVLVEAQAAGLRCITSTGVTQEANISNTVEFIDLNQSPKKWAEVILHKNTTRNDNRQVLIQKGYDSTTNVKKLTALYMSYY